MTTNIQHKTALVVDDTWLCRALYEQMFRQQWVKAKSVIDWLKAVEIATKEKFDYILMDINMPGIDWFEAAARIRRILGDNIKIFWVSAREEDRPKWESDFDWFFKKPITHHDIKKCLIT